MLETADLTKKVTKEEYKKLAPTLGERLAALQQPLRQAKLPVVILFEGWGAAGKGGLVGKLIENFDPRGFFVSSFIAPTELERREPVLWRYWKAIPKQGQIAIFDRSWYLDVTTARIEEKLDDKTVEKRLRDISTFERQLTDGGTLILKFFIHIDKKEQKKRFEKLQQDKDTAWRVTDLDWQRNRRYEEYRRAFDEALQETNTANAPWCVISGMDRRAAALDVFAAVVDGIDGALARKAAAAPEESCAETKIQPGPFHLLSMPKLAEIPLNRRLNERDYQSRLKEQQDLLSELHERMYRKKVPAVIAYEGWDAAGKGGNIRRVAKALDPRGYRVIPIAVPTPEELAHHYLWRFWTNLPRTGHIAVFDRTWYGRVLVERVEGLCKEDDWRRAYREINEFEHALCDWGAVVIKFWLQIDKDEQLRRFSTRQNTPSKQWKITDEDWRNRSKWDQYEICVNEMLRYTSTDFAPWHIVESQDKKYGRVQTLKIITDALRNCLK